MGDTIAAERRKERLAKALRENLRKRKTRATPKNELAEPGENVSSGVGDMQERSSCLPEAGLKVEAHPMGKRA